ncbi:alkaline phosphatase family protein [Sulfolobus acidocaldarius]|uniref:Conserved thermophile protein n=4 Tax=Sulfolobus acidocaldarius TaxID=2285 RepID=Q4JA91_SULAC|nr:alkaline phosphatase family protein [Sulfolobus acidocaldarius]AAY80289.1 conserved thermophile protein [Sulfolobus acidocaldarius DSM 639]AGE70869.1 hypothetical protein SacN8_04490 [Sulfolobus acidocaldarius N8]AGE73140.1 hypothetical protein SacRon12I_04480 [Sulfolobus acidocaldarius Ron12/I]ALU28822.1 nucleotide pyrophosphatase [Sulfolobus acidocaldarius]ALU31542.1 nucleotide pyrophosphatase [Sulfolobus acidocaldarius]
MEFVYPDYYSNSVYNLACAIADFLGVNRECKGKKLEISGRRIALTLLDGLGYTMLSDAGFTVDRTITTVFPSTTATTLTTLFTAQLPAEHGILGYTTYSKRLGGIINTLKYTYPLVDTRDIISEEGIEYEKAFPDVKNYLKEVRDKKTAEVTPKGLENTQFTKLTHGRTNITKTYINYWDAFTEASNILQMKEYDFVYIYIPDVDSLAHKHGPNHPVVKECIRDLYNGLMKLAERFKDYTFVITADHGHVQVNEHIALNHDSELLKLLDVVPYGDSRAVFLHSRYDLKTYLKTKYPNLEVFGRNEFEKLIGGNTSYADYIAVPTDSNAYVYLFKEEGNEYNKLKGHHGGLSLNEMKVPLVIWNG